MLWRTDIGQFVCNRCPHEHIRKNPQKTVLGGARWLAHPILRIPPRPTGEIMLVASSRPRHSSRWLGWAGAPPVLLPQSASCTCTTRRKEHDPDSEKPRCRCRCPSFGTPSFMSPCVRHRHLSPLARAVFLAAKSYAQQHDRQAHNPAVVRASPAGLPERDANMRLDQPPRSALLCSALPCPTPTYIRASIHSFLVACPWRGLYISPRGEARHASSSVATILDPSISRSPASYSSSLHLTQHNTTALSCERL